MAQLKDSLITGDLRVTGTIYGLGSDLTNINAGNITSGTLPVSRGGTGATTFTSGALLIGNGTNAVSTRSIKNMTATGNLGWTSSTTNIDIPTVNTLAYWNGRYNDSTSNLAYCNKGAFGNAATYGVDDATANGALGTGTGLTTERSVYYGLVTVNNASQTRATGIYAPTSAGTANQILVSAGGTSAPTWKATANGAAYATSANGALTFGTLPVAQGGTGVTTLDNLRDEINILQTKTYTGLIGSENNAANASFYFGKIIPTDFNTVWRIKYKIYAESAGRTDSKAISEVTITGSGSSIPSYSCFNSIISTSYRPMYYANIYRAKSAGATTYGHLLGVGLRSSWNQTTAANSRTIKVDILETENCSFTFFDTAVKYANAPGTGDTNYAGLTELDCCNNGLRETGDDNEYGRLAMHSSYYTSGGTLRVHPYTLFGFDRLGHAQPFSLYSAGYTGSTVSVNTARVYNTAGIDWTRGIVYSNSGSNFNVNSDMNITPMIAAYSVDFRNTDNCVASSSANTLGLVNRKPVYIRGVIKEDGLFYVAPISVTYNNATYYRTWTQDIPTTVEIDGTYQYVYWFVGYPYYNSNYPNSLYQVNLYSENKMYWYNDGKFEEYTIKPENSTFIVSFNIDETNEITCDKTYNEIIEALDNNKNVIGLLKDSEGGVTVGLGEFNTETPTDNIRRIFFNFLYCNFYTTQDDGNMT